MNNRFWNIRQVKSPGNISLPINLTEYITENIMKGIFAILTLTIVLTITSIFVVNRAYSLDNSDDISIEGTLLMLDDKTSHVAVSVQVIRNGELIDGVLSDENGKYQFIHLEPGEYQVRCYIGEYVYYSDKKNKPVAEISEATSLKVEGGKTFHNIDFRFPPFRKGIWKNYDVIDGLANNVVSEIYHAPDGVMWIGTEGGGVSCFDGSKFKNLTKKDGLADNWINAIHRDPDGFMWFGTSGGVSRYDGKEFVNLTTMDGLVNNNVWDIYHGSDGIMWFGTGTVIMDAFYGGVSRYDGESFVNFTTKDGLSHEWVNTICRDLNGSMWFGHLQGGISRYDGKDFINLSTKDGLVSNSVQDIYCDADGAMWFACSGGVSYYDGKKFINFTTKDGLASNIVVAINRSDDGTMWFGTHGGVSRYDGKGFINFTTEDGLANRVVNTIQCNPNGAMWFGTGGTYNLERGGVSRYDEKGFTNFTMKDGLPNNIVTDILSDSDGVMWFSTRNGVSHYDGNQFLNFNQEDGLAGNWVSEIYCDFDGALWFGTVSGGASRYDGKSVSNLSTKDGLGGNNVAVIYRDPNGIMWFGTWDGGLSRYDGKEFTNLTRDGLLNGVILSIHRDFDGMMWFGTYLYGVYRYDGKDFVNFTTEDSLAGSSVWSIHRGPDGMMWFGTWDDGLFRYDGKEFVNFTIEDGLAHNQIMCIYRDVDENMWIGTDGGGVCCYDGTAWTSLDTRDGLAGKTVKSIYQDADNSFWFATDGGATRYRPSDKPPKAQIVSVTTDQSYQDLSAIPSFTTGQRITIEYNAIDFKTVPEKRQYRCRIRETESAWGKPIKLTFSDYIFEEPGKYNFEVQAIDRDLNYSQPASVTLTIIPLWYKNGWIVFPSAGAIFVLLISSIFFGLRYYVQRQNVRAYERAAVQELQDANQMQMALMPTNAPSIGGLEIAGKCIPANTVSGDFFDYLEGKQQSEIALVVADVTGKAMKGAMNAVMADGILHAVAKDMMELSPASLMMVLNDVLKGRMEQDMNVTMVIGTIDVETKTLTIANAAHHAYPLLLSNGEIQPLKTGGLPLGMKAGVKYSEEEFQLASGDVIIFMTDGIIEAQDSEERHYSESGRLENTILQFTPEQPVEAMVDAILNDAMDFSRNKSTRNDDMTVVAAKIQ